MSVKVMAALWDCDKIKSPAELVLALALADSADRDTNEVVLSMATLSEMARSSERTTQGILKRLAQAGVLEIAYNAGPNGVNKYRLTPAESAPRKIGMTPMSSVSKDVTPSPEKNRDTPAESAPRKSLPPEAAVWNSFPQLPAVKSVSSSRERSLTARRRDEFWVDHFRSAVEKVVASDFCRGKNRNSWVATFDWMLQPDTVAKIIEGKYDNRKQATRFDVVQHGKPKAPTSGKKRAEDRPISGDPDPDTGKPLTREEIETKFPLSDYE